MENQNKMKQISDDTIRGLKHYVNRLLYDAHTKGVERSHRPLEFIEWTEKHVESIDDFFKPSAETMPVEAAEQTIKKYVFTEGWNFKDVVLKENAIKAMEEFYQMGFDDGYNTCGNVEVGLGDEPWGFDKVLKYLQEKHSQKTEVLESQSSDGYNEAEKILLKKCSENKVYLTSNELHTILEAMKEHARIPLKEEVKERCLPSRKCACGNHMGAIDEECNECFDKLYNL